MSDKVATVDRKLEMIYKRWLETWVALVEIERVSKPEHIKNYRKTLIDMLKRLKTIQRKSVAN